MSAIRMEVWWSSEAEGCGRTSECKDLREGARHYRRKSYEAGTQQPAARGKLRIRAVVLRLVLFRFISSSLRSCLPFSRLQRAGMVASLLVRR